MTKDKQQWLEGRRRGIGGSDVAAVLQLSPWRTPLDVWNDKLGLSPEHEMTSSLYWGTTLEQVVAEQASNCKTSITSLLIRKMTGQSQISTERLSIRILLSEFVRWR